MIKLNLVGGGKMGSALLKGVLTSGSLKADDIVVTESDEQGRLRVEKLFPGAKTAILPVEAETYLLAVKPYHVAEVLQEISRLKGEISPPVVLSIAAGVSMNSISSSLGGWGRVVRAMPNTAAEVGQSMTAVAFSGECDSKDEEFVRVLFESVGKVEVVSESYMDAVTAISGSGPAYFYLFCEALEEAGVTMGLPLSVARSLTRQTLLGAAEMMKASEDDTRKLRLDVTSPKGTTAAAMASFEETRLRHSVHAAVKACRDRSREITGEFEPLSDQILP